MVNYMEIVAHAHAVDTRPSLSSPSRRPGDEASTWGNEHLKFNQPYLSEKLTHSFLRYYLDQLYLSEMQFFRHLMDTCTLLYVHIP